MAMRLFLLFVAISAATAFQLHPVRTHHHHHTSKTALWQSKLNNHEKEMSRRDAFIASTATAAAITTTTPLPATAAIAEKLNTRSTVTYLEADYSDSVNTKGAPEKHLPSVTIEPTDAGGDKKSVTVEVPHVMDPEKPHFIEYIWLKNVVTNEILAAKSFKPTDASPPTITCHVKDGATVKALSFCNLHGLWQGEEVTV